MDRSHTSTKSDVSLEDALAFRTGITETLGRMDIVKTRNKKGRMAHSYITEFKNGIVTVIYLEKMPYRETTTEPADRSHTNLFIVNGSNQGEIDRATRALEIYSNSHGYTSNPDIFNQFAIGF